MAGFRDAFVEGIDSEVALWPVIEILLIVRIEPAPVR